MPCISVSLSLSHTCTHTHTHTHTLSLSLLLSLMLLLSLFLAQHHVSAHTHASTNFYAHKTCVHEGFFNSETCNILLRQPGAHDLMNFPASICRAKHSTTHTHTHTHTHTQKHTHAHIHANSRAHNREEVLTVRSPLAAVPKRTCTHSQTHTNTLEKRSPCKVVINKSPRHVRSFPI